MDSLTGQHCIQGQIHVVISTPDLLFLHKPAFGQNVQIFGGGDARHAQVPLHKLDLGIGVHEQVVDQILAVKLVACANALLVVKQRSLDGLHGGDGL